LLPATSLPLLDWRKKKEQKFVYNTQPNSQDAQEIDRIRKDIANKRSLARKILLSGASSKKNLIQRIKNNTKIPDSKLNALNKRREQARADLKYLNIPEPKIAPRQSTPLKPTKTPIQINRTTPQPSSPGAPVIPPEINRSHK
jgi:hypothetical protein